jgi:hypothetical protein
MIYATGPEDIQLLLCSRLSPSCFLRGTRPLLTHRIQVHISFHSKKRPPDMDARTPSRKAASRPNSPRAFDGASSNMANLTLESDFGGRGDM